MEGSDNETKYIGLSNIFPEIKYYKNNIIFVIKALDTR